MKQRIAALLVVIATLATCGIYHCGHATADLYQCPYPATGFQVRVDPLLGEAVGYVCDYPTEINGSHLHAEAGSYFIGGTSGINAPLPGLQGGNGGVTLGVGMGIWSQSYRCPNEQYMADPPRENIGAWNRTMTPGRCRPIGVAPLAINAPWPPDEADNASFCPTPAFVEPNPCPPKGNAAPAATPTAPSTDTNPARPNPVSPQSRGN